MAQRRRRSSRRENESDVRPQGKLKKEWLAGDFFCVRGSEREVHNKNIDSLQNASIAIVKRKLIEREILATSVSLVSGVVIGGREIRNGEEE